MGSLRAFATASSQADLCQGEPYDAERPISKDYQMRFPVHVQQSKLHGYITIVSSDEENPPRYHRQGDSKFSCTPWSDSD